ncbi:hypothetical protein PM082_013665 [Marasmius tenuissimus]|nr:hypothetical protein PM082_013665 [Marasmius tenuissimus]
MRPFLRLLTSGRLLNADDTCRSTLRLKHMAIYGKNYLDWKYPSGADQVGIVSLVIKQIHEESECECKVLRVESNVPGGVDGTDP